MTLATLSKKGRRTGEKAPRRHAELAAPTAVMPNRLEDLKIRVRRFLEREIDFVPNRCFRDARAEKVILGTEQEAAATASASKMPKDLPAHLARLCEAALLSADAERDLFRRMNYLKFRANALRTHLDPDRPNERVLNAAENLLAQAMAIRDRIIKANMRLVISIVKKFVGPQHSFDDMLSEGTMSLMHAVDKFDYDRGFRFSTYAYRAIARNAYRTIMDRHRENARFAPGSDEILFDVVDERGTGGMSELTWSRLRERLADMLDQLDRREQFIIRSRFALGAHRKVRTFQSLADRLGISKERVRQLEQRAVEKLQKLASSGSAD